MHESPPYAELHCLSNFTFLRGASQPEELVARAHALGYDALALTDECSLAGVVRAFIATRDLGFKLIVGSEFTLADGPRLVLLATDRESYGNLAELITRGRTAAGKGGYRVTRADVAHHAAGCLALLLPAGLDEARDDDAHAQWLATVFPGSAWIAAELLLDGRDSARLAALTELGRCAGLPLTAAGGVEMHLRARRRLHDTLTAIRLGTTVQAAGSRLRANAERCLRSRRRLAALYPRALLAASARIAARCTFALDALRYEYPEELVPPGTTPAGHLRRLTEQGMQRRWPQGAPDEIRRRVEHELALIAELRYEPYFLTVHDIVRYARSRDILCQGRGSAANSAVCFCLGITEVDPARIDTLFERFISRERNEPPDIDVDFEHERREEVIQYIYSKYGRERAALAATVITYRLKSAVRDVGKALGLTLEQVDRLAKNLQWWDGREGLPERLAEMGFAPDHPLIRQLIELVHTLLGFPRHLSQHVGGFVIARGRLSRLVPIENAAMPERTVIQWDKDDLDALGLLKVDCLGLGMLTAIHRAFDLVAGFRGTRHTLAGIPAEDPRVYAMIGRADTVGVFQIESRAQMAMLPRIRPACFYDLVIEVAIVRPGPIQGKMVHPYLRRRQGKEPVTYPSEAVRAVLERTLGVPIFQEQVIKLAMVAAGFTPGEADHLRRSMAAWRRRGGLEHFEQRLIDGMRARGYGEDFARRIFQQIQGFGEYGFPECVVGETRVVDADSGRWLTIDEVVGGHAVLRTTLACDENLRLRKRRVLAVTPSGRKAVFRLRTARGHTITATAEHPFLTLRGWRRLGELRDGDFVAAVRGLPPLGRRKWPRYQIVVLAALIAEGGLRHPRTFCFYTTDPRRRDEFVRAAGRFPNTRAVVEHHRNGFGVRVRRMDARRPAAAVTWVRALGLGERNARENCFPAEVFELCAVDVALLLARIWEGDGRLSVKGYASYETVSPRLATEIQHLLLRLGILARLWCRVRRQQNRQVDSHVVTVTGDEPLVRFWRHVGRRFLAPAKRRRAQSLATACADGRSRARERTRLASSDVYWDRVSAITPLGCRDTYDLQIEGDHNFLANHLVVHNSHAASFALLVYASAWLKCHEPAAFLCALLNSQPMGFYAPAQLTQDARRHGVAVRPVDVRLSCWDCALEADASGGASAADETDLVSRRTRDELPAFDSAQPAVRLGLRMVNGLTRAGAERLVAARAQAPFADVADLARRACLNRRDLDALAAAGALAGLGGHRHRARWAVAGIEPPLPLLETATVAEGMPLLRAPREGEDIVADYASVGLTLRRHPLALLRPQLDRRRLLSAAEVRARAHGQIVRTAGLVVCRQHPSSASGVIFVTLEDETGHSNIIVWPALAERQRRELNGARLLAVTGEVQREGEVLHVIARELADHSVLLGRLVARSRDFR